MNNFAVYVKDAFKIVQGSLPLGESLGFLHILLASIRWSHRSTALRFEGEGSPKAPYLNTWSQGGGTFGGAMEPFQGS